MTRSLLTKKDGKNYAGKYVAVSQFNSRKVIAGGKNPDNVIASARKQGCECPVIFFVPDPNVTYIY